MKYLILILLSLSTLSAQDREPSVMRFNYKMNGNTYTNTPLNRDSLIPKNYVISTQWGGHPRMLNALKFTSNESWAPALGTDPNAQLIRNHDTSYKLNHIWQFGVANVKGFIYEPTLYILPSQRGQFITKANDSTKAIWGFSQIRGSNVTGDNFDRLVLKMDSLPSYGDSTVLKNTWINHLFYVDGNPDHDSYTEVNGLIWNFSINLRRLNPNEHSSPDTILVVKLPYKEKTKFNTLDSGYVKFSKLPKTSIDSANIEFLNYYENLGNALKMNSDTNSYKIVILNSMIPDSLWIASGKGKDITINAEFICDDRDETKTL